jgi:hypothetical protein
VACLSAIKEAWFLILYSEVDGGESIRLLRGYGLETGIEDRLADRVKERLAHIVKGRERGCVVLLLEDESDNVARFSRHIRWYEGNLIWSRTPEGHFIDFAGGEGSLRGGTGGSGNRFGFGAVGSLRGRRDNCFGFSAGGEGSVRS